MPALSLFLILCSRGRYQCSSQHVFILRDVQSMASEYLGCPGIILLEVRVVDTGRYSVESAVTVSESVR